MKDNMNSYGAVACPEHRSDGPSRRQASIATADAGLVLRSGREPLPGLVEQRNNKLDIDSAEKRRQRDDLQSRISQQSGVDDSRAAFPQAKSIPGAADKKAAAASFAAASR
jgi:hypothetical protein